MYRYKREITFGCVVNFKLMRLITMKKKDTDAIFA